MTSTKHIIEIRKRKCYKTRNGYNMHIHCEFCGTQLNADVYYWNKFNLCPNCGTKITTK